MNSGMQPLLDDSGAGMGPTLMLQDLGLETGHAPELEEFVQAITPAAVVLAPEAPEPAPIEITVPPRLGFWRRLWVLLNTDIFELGRRLRDAARTWRS